MPPAAHGIQALTMNSLRSAWTPVLAGWTQADKQAKGDFRSALTWSYTLLSSWYKISGWSADSEPASVGLGEATEACQAI